MEQPGRTVGGNGLLKRSVMKGWGIVTALNGATVCKLELCLWWKCTVIKQTDKNSLKVDVRETVHSNWTCLGNIASAKSM